MILFSTQVIQGAIKTAPIYAPEKDAKNWMAIISDSPDAPGGLNRAFITKGKGDYKYIVRALQQYDCLEFGADKFDRGDRVRNRWFGVVMTINESNLQIQEYETGHKAIKAAIMFKNIPVNASVSNNAAEIAQIDSEIRALLCRINELQDRKILLENIVPF